MPFVLVLDGADLLTRQSTAAVTELVKHIPAGSMIVLSGRVLPKLPVAALRVGGPLLEIGPYELGLSRREAEILLRAAGVELKEEEIVELLERTEGWAAGLYLAALALDSEIETGTPRDVFAVSGADRYFADYFRSEYLSRLAPEQLTFLRRTSVLETMSGPLCDAVLERKESALELAALEAANVFVVPLDRHRGSYRYHHLFRDLLQRELEEREPELIPALNQRAADWFEAQGDAESTLHYSHRAGNKDSAARILSSIAMSVSSTGRMKAVESWLDHFDDEAELHRYPAVAVEGSRIHALRGRPDEARAWLAAAERGVPANGDGSDTRACIDVLRAAMCADGPERMLADTESALGELSPDHPWHPWALVVNGTAYLLLGEEERADQALAKAAEASDRLGRAESQSLALSERSLLAAARDDEEAETFALQAHRLIEDGELGRVCDERAGSCGDRARSTPPRPVGRSAQAADNHPTVGAELDARDSLAVRAGPARARTCVRDAARPRRGSRIARRGQGDPGPATVAGGARRTGGRAGGGDRGDASGNGRRRLGPDAGGATAPAAPLDPPFVPRDRRAALRLTQHDQDAGDLRLPQARSLEPQRGDRPERARSASSVAQLRRPLRRSPKTCSPPRSRPGLRTASLPRRTASAFAGRRWLRSRLR